MGVRERTPSTLDVSIDIAAPADIVFDAFFQDRALTAWLGTSRTIAVPRLLGPYVLEWRSETGRDDAGPGDGVLRGSVMHVEPGIRLFAADVYWLPLDAEPLGPLALEVTFAPAAQSGGSRSTLVRVVISGFDRDARWKQYHGSSTALWQRGLRGLKTLLEK